VSAMRVLLVEDDEDHVFLIRRAMSELVDVPVGVQVASNGEDAVSLLEAASSGQATRPDLVVLDLRLPKLGGLDVLRTIRANPSLAKTPLVVLTSSEDPDDHARARALGADDSICKPLDGASLRVQVQSLVRRWRVPPTA
jgi:DNA-binding response OmpR family regulator